MTTLIPSLFHHVTNALRHSLEHLGATIGSCWRQFHGTPQALSRPHTAPCEPSPNYKDITVAEISDGNDENTDFVIVEIEYFTNDTPAKNFTQGGTDPNVRITHHSSHLLH